MWIRVLRVESGTDLQESVGGRDEDVESEGRSEQVGQSKE